MWIVSLHIYYFYLHNFILYLYIGCQFLKFYNIYNRHHFSTLNVFSTTIIYNNYLYCLHLFQMLARWTLFNFYIYLNQPHLVSKFNCCATPVKSWLNVQLKHIISSENKGYMFRRKQNKGLMYSAKRQRQVRNGWFLWL